MKNKTGLLLFILAFLIVSQAEASIPDTARIVGEGLIEFPVSIVKILGGTCKLIGEIALSPFSMMS